MSPLYALGQLVGWAAVLAKVLDSTSATWLAAWGAGVAWASVPALENFYEGIRPHVEAYRTLRAR